MKPTAKEGVINPTATIIKSGSYYFFLLCLLTSNLLTQSLPDWAESRPADSRYYYGVGHASTLENNYEEIADESALKVIARQIYTDVYYESTDTLVEVDDKTIENKINVITNVITMAEIPGAIKDDWKITGEKIYYVLWKLDKLKHKENIELARGRTIELYKNYLKIDESDPFEQLSYLIPCYENVSRSVGADYMREDLGVDLTVEVPKIINDIITGFSLYSEKVQFNGIMRQPLIEPIEVQVRYRIQTSSGQRNISPEGIPISIKFSIGDATLASNTVSTDDEGNSVFRITEISPIDSYNSFYAYVDLNALRSDDRSFPKFEATLDVISQDRMIPFDLNATKTELHKVAHILISDELSKRNLTLLRAAFRSQLSRNDTYRIIRESNVLDKLDEWKKAGRNVCTDRDCQLEIGKDLDVNKLVFNNISYNTEMITCHMFLTNIDNQEVIFEKTYDLEIPPLIDAQNEDKVVKFLKDNITNIVTHFFKMANRGSINLSLASLSNVTAKFEKINPERWDDIVPSKTLPTGDLKLLAGQYKIELHKPGFEKKMIVKNIGERTKIKPRKSEIMLKQKLPGKALKKSLLFPGSGQRYQAEPGYESRKTVGMVFSAAAIGGLTLTAINWTNFFSKQKDYREANNAYLSKKILEEVVQYRTIAEQKNAQMLDARNSAIGATAALAAIWLSSALEAKYRFPDYNVGSNYSQRSVNLNLFGHNGDFEPKIKFSWSL